MPEHSTIQHADCHEPKHITTSLTSDTGKVITPSGTTGGTSELRKLKGTELDTTGGSESQALIIVSGAPAWTTLPGQVYGGLKLVDATASFVSTAAPAKMDSFDTAMPNTGVTVSTANDTLVVSQAGDYLVTFNVCCTCAATDDSEYTFHLRNNSIETGHAAYQSLTAANYDCMGFTAIVTLAASDELSIWIEGQSGGSGTLTITDAQFTAQLLKAS